MRVSCSLAIAATRATGIAVANSISNASNSNVNPDSGRAQPTATRCTPCSGQRVRGTRACRNALYWKKSKCRHVLSSVSCTGQEPSSQPPTEHPKRAPRGKSRYRSSRPCATSKSERVTRHGSPNPKAVLNRSRVSDIRPIPQHWATERHDPSWPTPRTPGRDTAKPTRSDEEPTICIDHSDDKENAAATWKHTFGFHPLLAFLDRPDIAAGEALAGLLRPGNAGSNTA